ncbi:MAG: hypothetical protein U5N85_15315 [Arcicella sp.]|nr:hypothetical protein [Arcicella sp.]
MKKINNTYSKFGGFNSKAKLLIIHCSLLIALTLTSCDKVVNDLQPIPTPTLPQPTAEVFKQLYPDVKEFFFKPLEQDKTWQADFVASTGKVQSLVDYQGELIDVNELVGTSKTLPTALKQYVLNGYGNAQIIAAYELMKNSTQNDGYKLTIRRNATTTVNLFFDANSAFVKEEIPTAELASSIIFTSTEQVNFEEKIPAVVKQFMSNNQLKPASVIVYILTDNTFKIVLNFRDRPNGALHTSEIVLTNQGQLKQWSSSIENEYGYKILKNNELSSDITTYLNTNFSGWTFDYGILETCFSSVCTNYANIKNGVKERFLVVDSELEKRDLVLIRTQLLDEADLLPNIRNSISSNYSSWTYVSGRVVYEPYFQATRQGGTVVNHYQFEVKENNIQHTIRLAEDGKVIYKYKN